MADVAGRGLRERLTDLSLTCPYSALVLRCSRDTTQTNLSEAAAGEASPPLGGAAPPRASISCRASSDADFAALRTPALRSLSALRKPALRSLFAICRLSLGDAVLDVAAPVAGAPQLCGRLQ